MHYKWVIGPKPCENQKSFLPSAEWKWLKDDELELQLERLQHEVNDIDESDDGINCFLNAFLSRNETENYIGLGCGIDIILTSLKPPLPPQTKPSNQRPHIELLSLPCSTKTAGCAVMYDN